jgi:two-component system, OmpR family, sensor histidine kinase YxdK
MYLLALIIKTAKVKKTPLIALYINTFTFLIFYYLLQDRYEFLYPFLLSSVIILIYFTLEVATHNRLEKDLKNAVSSPDYREPGANIFEKEMINYCNSIHSNYIRQIEEYTADMKEKEELFSTLIHSMKNSVSIIEIVCEKQDTDGVESSLTDAFLDISMESKILKDSLNRCLTVLRLSQFSKDYLLERISLKSLVKNIINAKKRDFIYNEVFPVMEIDEKIYVYSDYKWCSYMVEQVLDNAIKYSKPKGRSTVVLSAKKDNDIVLLEIKDEGIGIVKEDLDRVFEPFFTGENGRLDKNATGIGLYIVGSIARKLKHEIKIASIQNKGTTVEISFSTNDRYYNLTEM